MLRSHETQTVNSLGRDSYPRDQSRSRRKLPAAALSLDDNTHGDQVSHPATQDSTQISIESLQTFLDQFIQTYTPNVASVAPRDSKTDNNVYTPISGPKYILTGQTELHRRVNPAMAAYQKGTRTTHPSETVSAPRLPDDDFVLALRLVKLLRALTDSGVMYLPVSSGASFMDSLYQSAQSVLQNKA
jgi:hypothetical protein